MKTKEEEELQNKHTVKSEGRVELNGGVHSV